MEETTVNIHQLETIHLSGELTINQVRDLHELLKLHLEDANGINLNLADVTEIDIASLQLICSAHRTFQQSGREITIEGSIPESIRQLIEKTGFNAQNGCRHNKENTCLWKNGR